MPRGKIANEMLNFKANASDAEAKEEQKNNAAKFTLIEPDAQEDNEDDSLVRSIHSDFNDTIESSRPNFKFTLLLVTLFVAVNVGLITLLDNNKTSPTPAVAKNDAEVITNAVGQKTAAPNIKPVAAVEKPVLGKTEAVEKPVLGGDVTASKTTVTESPVVVNKSAHEEKPVTLRRQPSATQDLLSIVGKN